MTLCNTKENPADLASRGVQKVRDLVASIWFHGPSFLWQLPAVWPNGSTDLKVSMDDPIVKSSCAVWGWKNKEEQKHLQREYQNG